MLEMVRTRLAVLALLKVIGRGKRMEMRIGMRKMNMSISEKVKMRGPKTLGKAGSYIISMSRFSGCSSTLDRR